MKTTLWRDLFYSVQHARHFDDEPGRPFSPDPVQFPAIALVSSWSQEELLLLAFLIPRLESEPEQQPITFEAVLDAFGDLDHSPTELRAALFRLYGRGLLRFSARKGVPVWTPNRIALEKAGLYIHNPWHHLAGLDLFDEICDN